MDAAPVVDRTGTPILAGDSWVHEERVNPLAPGRQLQRAGAVIRVTSDHVGALIYYREWKAGRFTGRLNATRPQHLTVVRAPDKAREELAEEARRAHDRKVRKEEEERQARLKKLRAEEEKKR